MPKWDLKCPRCSVVIEHTFKNLAQRDEWLGHLMCEDCSTDDEVVRLELQPSAPSFSINGYCASNGYSRPK